MTGCDNEELICTASDPTLSGIAREHEFSPATAVSPPTGTTQIVEYGDSLPGWVPLTLPSASSVEVANYAPRGKGSSGKSRSRNSVPRTSCDSR